MNGRFDGLMVKFRLFVQTPTGTERVWAAVPKTTVHQSHIVPLASLTNIRSPCLSLSGVFTGLIKEFRGIMLHKGLYTHARRCQQLELSFLCSKTHKWPECLREIKDFDCFSIPILYLKSTNSLLALCRISC